MLKKEKIKLKDMIRWLSRDLGLDKTTYEHFSSRFQEVYRRYSNTERRIKFFTIDQSKTLSLLNQYKLQILNLHSCEADFKKDPNRLLNKRIKQTSNITHFNHQNITNFSNDPKKVLIHSKNKSSVSSDAKSLLVFFILISLFNEEIETNFIKTKAMLTKEKTRKIRELRLKGLVENLQNHLRIYRMTLWEALV